MKKESKNTNLEIANIFYEIANILEMKNIAWKPQAYRIAAQTLESLRYDIKKIYKQEGEKGVDNLPGIGEGLTKKIIEYLKTQKINEHEKLKRGLPENIYKIMKIPGIGVKRAMLFYKKLGIKNIKDLKNAAKQGKLVSLPGFKERAQQKVLEKIEMKINQQRISIKEAKKIAEIIIKQLKRLKEIKKAVVAGSLRRRKPSIRDIDIVILTNHPKKTIERFIKMNFVKKVLNKGEEKATILSKRGIQTDIRVFTKKEFGAGLLYFTGDKQHNIWLRKIAIKKGWKLNEYGLFDRKTGKRIAGKSEKEIYDKLGIKMLSPKKRIGETE